MHQMNAKISYITLGVSDLNRMQEFYTGMGFKIYAQSDNQDHPYAMYKSGALVLALYPKDLLAKQCGCSISDSDNNAAMSLSLNVSNKQQVDSYLKTATELNADIRREGFEPAWGGYCGYFKDPEGNLWEIVWHEKFNIDD